MALYMTQITYTSEAWAAQLKNPQDRRPVFAGLAERCGGKLRDAYLSFGDYDVVVIYEVPDAKAAAAVAMRVAAGGHCKGVKTTELLSVEEGVEAMRQGGGVSYQVPGQ